jgi:hypothetical protein
MPASALRVIAAGALAWGLTGFDARATDRQAAAQESCRAAMPPPSDAPNIFSAEQERHLGDVTVEHLAPILQVIDDERLTAHLRRIGARLAAHLPAGALEPHFFLTEMGPDAFTLPGARIYVSRHLVGLTRSEDELAGVVAHELGHIVARHLTVDITRALREVLRVTELGDREDVRAKYHQLIDNDARQPRQRREREAHTERSQIEADRLAVFLVAAAGYDPQAWVAVLDRIMGTEGKTGNVFSRMFGTTSPEATRLRESIKLSAAVPASCPRPADAAQAETYATWQAAVAAHTPPKASAVVPGLISRTQLPTLPTAVRRVRFSPDGRHVLAADDGGLSVLTREPFALAFRIDNRPGAQAHFTPDSQHVVVLTGALRVEWWRLAAGTLARSRDVASPDGCRLPVVSPNGKVLSCRTASSGLLLLDVESGTTLFHQKGFFEDNFNTLFTRLKTFGPSAAAPMQFSPDGRYFIAGFPAPDGGPRILVLDMTAPKPRALKLPWAAGKYLINSYAFVAPDRIIGLNAHDSKKSGYVALPSGEVTGEFVLPVATLRAVTRGDAVTLSPFQKYDVGVVNLSNLTSARALTTQAYDQYDDVFVAETGSGDLALCRTANNTVIARTTLPGRPFGEIQAAAVSADGHLLAVSVGRRAAVWNLRTGQQTTLARGFASAHFDTSGRLIAEVSELGADPRRLMMVELPSGRMTPGAELAREVVLRDGWLVASRPLPPNVLLPKGVEYEFVHPLGAAPGWKKTFAQERPLLFRGSADAVVLRWDADTPAGRARVAAHKALARTVKLGDIAGDYILEVHDAATGAIRGAMHFETGKGSIRAFDHIAAGNVIVTSDDSIRVLVHDLETGQLRGHAFGTFPAIHEASGTMAISLTPTVLAVFDLATMTRREELKFDAPVLYRTFSADGSRLIVLTADQSVFTVATGR